MTTLFEEAIRDQLVTGLTDVTLYGVRLEPESLDLDATFRSLPDNLIHNVNANNVIQVKCRDLSSS